MRYFTLDGWRGVSILFVLAGHLLPLGPSSLKLNSAFAATGMALFFILSGFLITSILLNDQRIGAFLIRRFLRIIPLAWLVLLIILIIETPSLHHWLSNLFFYANWEPMGLLNINSHFWSLSVEMQFYVFVALLVLVLRKKGLFLLPALCISVTIFRIYNEVEIAINTYYRIDEILAGCILAIIYNYASDSFKNKIGRLNTTFLLLILIASAHSASEYLNYARPYLAMLTIGSTLFKEESTFECDVLNHKFLVYMAYVSFAVYVFHGVLRETWLGSGDTIEKYAKRPLLFIATFALSHVSTKYYEAYWQKLAKSLTAKIYKPRNKTDNPLGSDNSPS